MCDALVVGTLIMSIFSPLHESFCAVWFYFQLCSSDTFAVYNVGTPASVFLPVPNALPIHQGR